MIDFCERFKMAKLLDEQFQNPVDAPKRKGTPFMDRLKEQHVEYVSGYIDGVSGRRSDTPLLWPILS